jgi:methionyl aminopeptidase
MVFIKTKNEVQKLTESNRIAAKVLTMLTKEIKPGLTTLYLDGLAEQMILDHGALPGFKNYRGYKYTLCTSVNHQIIHGVPTTQRLKDGDIVSIDVGVLKDGYYGDTAITLPVGEIDKEKQELLNITYKALLKGISTIAPDMRTGDISKVIHDFVSVKGYDVIYGYGGHGVGAILHEDPFIPNMFSQDHNVVIKEGMVFALEPMVVRGSTEVKTENDGWTVSTKKGNPAAHFEHTVLVTNKGSKILSKRQGEGNDLYSIL